MTSLVPRVAGRETGAQHPFSPSVHCARKGSPCASTRPSRSRSASRLLVVALALLVAVASTACGREVVAPKVSGCVKVDTLWRRDDGAVLVMTTYYPEPCSKGKP